MKKSRVILLIVALIYNLALGFWLRNFLCLSPTLQVFYLISFLPTLFLLFEVKSKAMRSVIFILFALIFLMNLAYAVYCRRVFPFLAIISVAIVLIYFTVFADSRRKDNLLTKIFVLIVSTSMIALLFTAYIFVYKQDDVSLINGQATLWDTETVELADEICADCYTDEEKIKAIHEWMIHNFEYDYGYTPIVQYSNVHQTVETRRGICYDFAHFYLLRSVEAKIFLVMLLMELPMILQKIVILGTEFTLTVRGGMWMLRTILFKSKSKTNYMDFIVFQTPIRMTKYIT